MLTETAAKQIEYDKLTKKETWKKIKAWIHFLTKGHYSSCWNHINIGKSPRTFACWTVNSEIFLNFRFFSVLLIKRKL